jgi:hypothetical protein
MVTWFYIPLICGGKAYQINKKDKGENVPNAMVCFAKDAMV